jgi:hypothetical protein
MDRSLRYLSGERTPGQRPLGWDKRMGLPALRRSRGSLRSLRSRVFQQAARPILDRTYLIAYFVAALGPSHLMQVLVPFAGNPEDYQSLAAQRQMTPPSHCPNCGSARKLRLHGYYERYVSTKMTGEAIRLSVRRFRCRDCQLTTSLLPWFCLSYRLVRGESVARFLRGEGIDACDLRWHQLLGSCQRRFEVWYPVLSKQLSVAFGMPLDGLASRAGWSVIENLLGGISSASQRVVSKCRVTLFGRYVCHSPGCSRFRGEDAHRHPLFPSGTDPPK